MSLYVESRSVWLLIGRRRPIERNRLGAERCQRVRRGSLERPKNPTTHVDWVVATNTGSPKIVDLLAEGSSLGMTKSADFTAYLARQQYNIHELFESTRERLSQNGWNYRRPGQGFDRGVFAKCGLVLSRGWPST